MKQVGCGSVMAHKPKIIITETDWVADDAIDRLREVFDVCEGPFSRDELVVQMRNAVGCFVGLDHRIDVDMMGGSLRFIASPTTGLNHIDVDEAQKRSVEIISLKGEVAFLDKITATAELCWGLILSLLRHIPQAHQSVMDGAWDRDRFRGRELQQATIGIIGYGRLGRKIASYARAFDMNVLIHSNQPFEGVDFCSMDELMETSDIISLHADSKPENYHMIGRAEFSKMKPTAYFINTARGDLLDEAALLKVLNNDQIAGAALDVLEGEFNPDHSSAPLIEYAQSHDNLIIVPHIGGVTVESQYKVTHFIVDKLLEWWSKTDG